MEEHVMKDNNIKKAATVSGAFGFFTCKTGTGRDRYCVKVHGKIEGEDVTVQAWGNWDGALPESLAAVCGDTTYIVPETGLIRSIGGMLEGSVEVPAGTEVESVPGRVREFLQVTLESPESFKATRTSKKMVKFA